MNIQTEKPVAQKGLYLLGNYTQLQESTIKKELLIGLKKIDLHKTQELTSSGLRKRELPKFIQYQLQTVRDTVSYF